MGYTVHMIIQKLLLLECEAKEAMQALEKEQALLTKKAEADLSLRMTMLKSEKERAAERLTQQAEKNASETIAKIQAEYKQKESELTQAFATSGNAWKKQIAHQVLHEWFRV